MSLRAGRLRHRVTLVARAEAQDAYGEPIPTTSAVGTFWAEVRALTGREGAAALQVRATLTHQVTMRAIGVAIDPKVHRLAWKGRTLEIVSAADPSGTGSEWLLLAEERV